MRTFLRLIIQNCGSAKIVFVCLLLVTQSAIADEKSNPRIRHEFSAQNAPPNIRFRAMLNMLTSTAENSDIFAASVLKDAGFKPEDMTDIHNYLISISRESDAEVDKDIWRVACHSESESLKGLEVRVVYNSFDDIRYAVAAKYLAIASAELAAMGYPHFLESVERFPGNSSSFKTFSTEHRLAWGEADSDIKANRERLCDSLLNRYGEDLAPS